jgi:DNA-binding XRE family transcriptional regulator
VIRQEIKNARKYNGFTQEGFSYLLGCTKDYYAKIERGKALPNILLA